MREKNSERPDTRDNRSKNSTKTGKKKKNTKNQEFAVITYSFLALFICLMGYFSYFQFFKSEEFINNPYNTRQETFAQKIVRGQILTNDGQVLAETVTDSEGNETRRYPYGSIFSHIVGYSTKGKSGIESLANFNLLRSNTAFIDKVGDEMQGEKSPGDNVVTTLDYGLQATAYDALGYYKGAIVVLEPSTGKILAMVSKPDFDPNTIAADWDNLTADENTDAALLNRAETVMQDTETAAAKPKKFIQVDDSYFDDAVFIGDSRTVGLHDYGGLDHSDFFATVGMNIYDLWKDAFCEVNGKKVTLEEALKAKQYKKVYFQIGINEMGRGTLDGFMNEYQNAVEKFKTLQPDAVIYVQAIMHVTQKKSDSDPIFNNPGIDARNQRIQQLADGVRVFYIDVNEVVCDDQGGLKQELTFDNLHLYGSKYNIWVDFLKTKGIGTE